MIRFPTFLDVNLIHCRVGVSFSKPIVSLPDRLQLVLNPKGGKKLYALVVADPTGHYLHVEMAVAEWFKRVPQKRLGRKQDFSELVERIKGNECLATVEGTFRAAPDELLPGLIPSSSLPRSRPEDSMFFLSAAQFTVKEKDIDEFGWRLIESEDEDPVVEIKLGGKLELVMSDFYLEEAASFLVDHFQAFTKVD